MRKLTYSLAAITVLAAVVFVWSRTALVSVQATDTTVGAGQGPSARISPTEITIRRAAPLPVEAWDAY